MASPLGRLSSLRSTVLSLDATAWVALFATGVGIALRVESFANGEVAADGALYSYAAGSWLQSGRASFVWSEPGLPLTFASLPLIHIFTFVPVFAVWGIKASSAKLAGLVVSLVSLAATFLATRDLFGRHEALVTTAIVACVPVAISAVGTGYGENALLIFVVLTLWALVKGLQDDRYFGVFGLCAVGLLLTKQEVSPYLAAGGVIGFYLWRFGALRRSILTSPGSLLVGPVILAEVLTRNVASGRGATGAFSILDAVGSLGFWTIISLKLLFVLAILLSLGVYFLREILRGVLPRPPQVPFAMALTIIVIVLVAALESSLRTFYEFGTPLFSRDDQRYVFTAFVPLLWFVWATRRSESFDAGAEAAARRTRVSRTKSSFVVFSLTAFAAGLAALYVGVWLFGPLAIGSAMGFVRQLRLRTAVVLITFIVVAANSATSTLHYGTGDAVRQMDCWAQAGDVVALETPNRSITFPDVYINSGRRDFSLVRWSSNASSQFVLSDGPSSYSGFQLLGRYPSFLERTGLSRFLAFITGSEIHTSAEPVASLWMSTSVSSRVTRC